MDNTYVNIASAYMAAAGSLCVVPSRSAPSGH